MSRHRAGSITTTGSSESRPKTTATAIATSTTGIRIQAQLFRRNFMNAKERWAAGLATPGLDGVGDRLGEDLVAEAVDVAA